jgi:membrane peptidoglycan carboxypeptidase
VSSSQPPTSGHDPKRPTSGGQPATRGPGARKARTSGPAANSRGVRARRIAKKVAKWTLIVAFLASLAGALTIYIIYKTIDIPDPNTDFQAQTTTVYYSDGKHVLGQFAMQNRTSIDLEEMPQHVRDAVIAAENRSFYSDSGLDFKGMLRAGWNNFTSDSTQGASTITQQYVKILYLSQERTYTRKVKEAFIAVKIQNELSKDEILEGYLNTIYFGRGAYGIQAAAQAYFDKDAKDLTVAEGAVLASVLNSPGTFDPAVAKGNRERLIERYRYVLDGMVEMDNLDAEQGAKLARRLPPFPEIEEGERYAGQKGYLLKLVEQKLLEQKFTEDQINGGGLTVITTLDWKKQRAANQAVNEVRPNGKKQLHIALSSVEPGTGALRAMIGGRDFLGEEKQAQVNWALAGSQPGSSFKPFALTAGLEDGFTLRDTFDGNSPYVFPDGTEIENQGESAGQSFGQVNMVTATERSINTAYIDMTVQMDDGPEKVVDAASALGIPRKSRDLEPRVDVALGGAVISNVEMAEAYGTFAAQGVHADWYVIERVTDSEGELFRQPDNSTRVFSADIISNVTYALTQVIEEGTGSDAQALERPAAGKTGTATDDNGHVSSSWFVGYTPQLSTAVMYARGDGNDPLDGYLDSFYGGDYPTETWTTYMQQALEGEKVLKFPEPAELEGVEPTFVPPETTAVEVTEPATTEPTTTAPATTQPTTTAPTTTAPPTTEPTTTEPTETVPTSTEPSTTEPEPTTAPTTSAPPPEDDQPPDDEGSQDQ